LVKLRAFGIDLDRPMLEALCRDALSAQEVADRLMGPLAGGLPAKHREITLRPEPAKRAGRMGPHRHQVHGVPGRTAGLTGWTS
jgi:hypothetical protein